MARGVGRTVRSVEAADVPGTASSTVEASEVLYLPAEAALLDLGAALTAQREVTAAEVAAAGANSAFVIVPFAESRPCSSC